MKNKTNKEAQETIQPQTPKDMNTRTIELMNNMHLFGMSEAYKTSLGSTFAENMTPDAFLFMLLNNEWDHRHTDGTASHKTSRLSLQCIHGGYRL